MSALVTNNAVGALLVGISDTETALLLRAGQGPRFPAPVFEKDWFYITVQDEVGNMELMKCTARDGDTLTVTRGYGGTVALAFKAACVVELRPCAELFNDKVDYDVYNAALTKLRADFEDFKKQMNMQFQQLTGNTTVALDEQAQYNKDTYVPFVGNSNITGTLKVDKIETPSIKMVTK